MTKALFSPEEWKSVLNAPQWVYTALVAANRGSISTRRTEAKALNEFLAGYKTQSPIVKEILADQEKADDKIDGSQEDAEKALAQLGALIEKKLGAEEGDAVRDLLTKAGEAVANATREALFGDRKSASEEKALAGVATALKATEADKNRRYQAAVAAAAKQAQAQKEAAAGATAEAKKQAEEAAAKKLAAEAEAKRREAEAQAAAHTAAPQAAAPSLQGVASAVAGVDAAQSAAPAIETTRIYVVKKGDTLSGISLEVYGKAGRWREIYEANKDIIKRPNLIRPGWKLRIP